MGQRTFASHYGYLSKKWRGRHEVLRRQLWKKHKTALGWLRDSSQNLVMGSVASVMLLTHPLSGSLLAQLPLPPQVPVLTSAPVDKKESLIAALELMLPKAVEPLTAGQEIEISRMLSDNFHFPLSAEMEGIRLNRNYGLIGAEQHLARYKGDTMDTHFDSPQPAKIVSSGMAPGLGGWGYFDTTEQEKYYIAVPVFLSPGWKENVGRYVKFYRFRKMLVVNPENGKAIVAVVGDAGPAEWTGKHLGGSPEVMDYLERVDGRRKGPVLYFFIDDPEGKVPLGPISIP